MDPTHLFWGPRSNVRLFVCFCRGSTSPWGLTMLQFGCFSANLSKDGWQVFDSKVELPSLKLTFMAPENGGPLEVRRFRTWKPPFLGANC